MESKRKKIISLAVFVMLIAVLGLVSAVSAELPSVPDILNDRYGPGNWTGPLSETNIRFTADSTIVVVYVDDHVAAYTDPTGWYETDSGIKHELFSDPEKEDFDTFEPGEEFGIYIDAGPNQPYITYYSQSWKNPYDEIHAKLYKVTGGDHSGAYVVAFEDLPLDQSDKDYNDVVLELKHVTPVPVPEFTTIAIPVCMIFGLFYFFRRKRQNE